MHRLLRHIAAAAILFSAGVCAQQQPHAKAREAVLEVVSFAMSPRDEQRQNSLQPAPQDYVYAAQLRAPPAASASQPATLFTVADAIGFPDSVATQLTEIFADQVDFHRDLNTGYRCSIVYEVIFENGQIAGAGRVLAADLVIQDRRYSAFFHDEGGGKTGYYSENGTSLTRTFRRSPLEFTRITSQYSLARRHPILGVWRAHRGVDYAAPAGTKVLAAADGVLDFAGERGAYGKLVVLRHTGGYFTYYAHLASYKPGLKGGEKVSKGEVIGAVGMTGLATAPHLHYEFRIADAAGERISVPPLDQGRATPSFADSVRLPEWRKIDASEFFERVHTYRAMLGVARETHFVMLQ